MFSANSQTIVLVLRHMTSSSTGGLDVEGGGGVALDTGGCGCGFASVDVWLLTACESCTQYRHSATQLYGHP